MGESKVPHGVIYSTHTAQLRHIAESGVYISTTREYTAESGGVYFQLQGSILLSQRCVFGNSELQHTETEKFWFCNRMANSPQVLTIALYSSHTQYYHNSQIVALIFQFFFCAAIKCLLGVLNHAQLCRRYCSPAAGRHYPDRPRQ